MGKRNNLKIINIFNKNAELNEDVPSDYIGLNRFTARKKLLIDLKKIGFLVKEEKNKILSFLADKLPTNKPRYLMGVGKPEDIVEAVRYGIDMFDCVLPTRNARNGQLITSTGVVNIKNAVYIKSDDPIDENCDCKVSKNYSRAYLNHLFRKVTNSFEILYFF